jgi:hypothetical protein
MQQQQQQQLSAQQQILNDKQHLAQRGIHSTPNYRI